MEKDLISIIVPVYNVEKYLNKCVESLINQTYKNIEIILVNDGSPDKCPEMCDDWAKKDKRIKVIHKQNEGQGAARNLAIEKCRGNYICFVDSDDWVNLMYIEKLYNALIENNADISICGVSEFYEKNKCFEILSQTKSQQVFEHLDIFPFAYKNQDLLCLGPCNKMYKKEIFKNIKFPTIRMYEDSAIYLNIFHVAQKIVIIPDILYYYLIRNNSTMHNNLTKIRSDSMFIQSDLRISFLTNNNYDYLLYYEIIRCLHNCFGQYRSTKNKDLKKTIKKKYLDYRNKYKKIVNFKNAPIKLKIKMLYLSIF